MSWLTDLYIFGKIIDRTERKMKEKNDQAARNLKRLYDAEKIFMRSNIFKRKTNEKNKLKKRKLNI